MKFCLLAMSLCAAAVGQEVKPDFSGGWHLNAGKSDFGRLAAPLSQIFVVAHNEPTLKLTSTVKTDQGEETTEYNLTTDAQEATNSESGRTFKTKAEWQNKDLAINAVFESAGETRQVQMQWVLAPNGKTLTVYRMVVLTGSAVLQKLVFDKK